MVTLAIVLTIVALFVATFSSTVCRGATVAVPKGDIPAPIDFGDAIKPTEIFDNNEISFFSPNWRAPNRVFAHHVQRGWIGVACALVLSFSANATNTGRETHKIANNCHVHLYVEDNTVTATAIVWEAKQSKKELTEAQCDKQAESYIVSGRNDLIIKQ